MQYNPLPPHPLPPAPPNLPPHRSYPRLLIRGQHIEPSFDDESNEQEENDDEDEGFTEEQTNRLMGFPCANSTVSATATGTKSHFWD